MDNTQQINTEKKFPYRKFILFTIVLAIINVLLSPIFYNYVFFPMFVDGKGWGALIFGGIYFVIIELPVVSLLSLVLIRFLIRDSLGKKTITSILFQLVSIFVIFIVVGYISSFVFGIFNQKQVQTTQKTFEKENPIDVGTKQYNFLKDALFHTSIYPGLYGNYPTIHDLKINNNTVTWSERTRNSPPYSENVLDLFMFKFDVASSQGTLTQVSHNESATTMYKDVEDSLVLKGKIYWTRMNDNGSRTLIVYDTLSGKEEVLFTDIRGLIGGYENRLLLMREHNIPLGDNSYRTEFKVSLYDLLSKNETPIDVAPGIVNENYMCHVNKDWSIGIYDIDLNKDITIVHTLAEKNILTAENKDMEVVYGVQVLVCSKNYIIYSFGASVPGKPAPIEMHSYVINKDGKGLDQKIDKIDGAKLIGNYLYYSNEKGITQKDIITGDEKLIISVSGINGWSIDGDYITYQKINEQGKAEFYLKKIK